MAQHREHSPRIIGRMMKSPVRKVVFPVGGLGTRFLPVTKAVPKEMLPVVDKPLIQYAVEEARAAGIEEFIFVTSAGKAALEDHFGRHHQLEDTLASRGKDAELRILQATMPDEGSFSYTRQQQPLGLGHAVWCARNLIANEPFAVMLADDLIMAQTPCLKQMIDVYNRHGGNVIATMEVPHEQTARYGVIDAGGVEANPVPVRGLVEKPSPDQAPSNLAVIGRYILQPEVFSFLDRKETGAGGEIQLTDAMAKLIADQPFHGLKYEGVRFDCGDRLGFVEANVAYALARDDIGAAFAERLREYANPR